MQNGGSGGGPLAVGLAGRISFGRVCGRGGWGGAAGAVGWMPQCRACGPARDEDLADGPMRAVRGARTGPKFRPGGSNGAGVSGGTGVASTRHVCGLGGGPHEWGCWWRAGPADGTGRTARNRATTLDMVGGRRTYGSHLSFRSGDTCWSSGQGGTCGSGRVEGWRACRAAGSGRTTPA